MLVRTAIALLDAHGFEVSECRPGRYTTTDREGVNLFFDDGPRNHARNVFIGSGKHSATAQTFRNFISWGSFRVDRTDVAGSEICVSRGYDIDDLRPYAVVRRGGEYLANKYLPPEAAALPTPVLLDWLQDNGHLTLS